MRDIQSFVLFEDLFEFLPGQSTLVSKYAQQIFEPSVIIAENDCGVTLGKRRDVSNLLIGEVTTDDSVVNDSLITSTLLAGNTKLNLRSASTCRTTNGLCKKCYEATYFDTATVGDIKKVSAKLATNAIQLLGSEVPLPIPDTDDHWAQVVLLAAFDSDPFDDFSTFNTTGYFSGTLTSSNPQFQDGSALAFISYTGAGIRYWFTITDDFTIESDIMVSQFIPAGAGGFHPFVIFNNWAVDGSEDRFVIIVYPSGGISVINQIGGYSNTQSVSSPAGVISPGTKYKIAVTRSGTTVRIFVNGYVVATGTITGPLYNRGATDNVNTLQIGYANDGVHSNFWESEGYVDNYRITNGFCRYTTNYIPRVGPFPIG